MSETVISVENLYKEYKLGVISHGTLYHDMQSWWARIRGKEDPNSIISAHHSSDVEEGSFLALNDVSFEVKEGEILGIIGKNGAGKSTLLKILSRITSPTKGQIKIKGRVGSLLEVGTGFHPELTGRENIYLNGAILGMRKWEIDKKLDEIIDFAGIERHIDTPVKRYSSGMYVRLAFSVAAHLDPEILAVDEVLAVGDADFQKKCLGKMKDISEGQGRTVLFVSHNMGAVKNLCSKALILSKGVLDKIGETKNIIQEYMSNGDIHKIGKVDLSIADRIKSYSPLPSIFEGWIETYDGKTLYELFMGTPIKVCFSFKAKRKIINPMVGLIIKNGYGDIITYTTSKHLNKSYTDTDTGKVEFDLGIVPLMPGKYYISLQLYENVENYVDIIIDAFSFSVIPSNEGSINQYTHGGIFYMAPNDIKLIILKDFKK